YGKTSLETAATLLGWSRSSNPGVSAWHVPRTSVSKLPIKEPQNPPITEIDARNAKAPPRFEVKAPQGAPKVALLKLEGYSNEEIARSLDCSLRTVERKLEVIRKRWTAEGTP